MTNLEKIKENRKKWVAALRSGDYIQGHNYLCRDDNYCCLGVLSEIAGAKKTPAPSDAFISTNVFLFDKDGFTLSDRSMKFVGLSTPIGRYQDKNGNWQCLVDDNDINGFTFNELADLIESEPNGLFEVINENEEILV